MNSSSIFILKSIRRVYTTLFGRYEFLPLRREENPDKVSDMIYELLNSGKPCMIARYGAFELSTVVNYLGIKQGQQSYLKYIQGKSLDWWWNERLLQHMHTNAGFFPPTKEKIVQFCELMLEDSKQVDILGSWMNLDVQLNSYLSGVKRVHLRLLEPFWGSKSWSRALKGRRVVVVHPFVDDIMSQYERRNNLFIQENTLPKFDSLRVIKAVQSAGGTDSCFKDWFEALEHMKSEIDREDYDICLIGCGAYGFPLAAHVKRSGKQAIHMGGALQLLFGIRGNRWDDPNYGVKEWGIPRGSYSNLVNDYWVRPNMAAKPKNAEQVEGACYW